MANQTKTIKLTFKSTLILLEWIKDDIDSTTRYINRLKEQENLDDYDKAQLIKIKEKLPELETLYMELLGF